MITMKVLKLEDFAQRNASTVLVLKQNEKKSMKKLD